MSSMDGTVESIVLHHKGGIYELNARVLRRPVDSGCSTNRRAYARRAGFNVEISGLSVIKTLGV